VATVTVTTITVITVTAIGIADANASEAEGRQGFGGDDQPRHNGQFEIDTDRRSWIRRSACCRSLSALS
jgi:hypothetical protein